MAKEPFSIIKRSVNVPLIANIPHSSTYIPSFIKQSFILSDGDLYNELLKLTDKYVDEFFSCVPDFDGISMIYRYSRMIVDPERFEDDQEEIMSSKGMGVIYTKTSNGNKLRISPKEDEREELLDLFYRPYHSAIEREVQNLIDAFNRCLILDCHSFPSNPLPYELNQDPNRPDICLGTDPYHTPKRLIEIIESFFGKYDLTTSLNMPFDGTYVPMKFLRSDRRVFSLMV
jgi:N-formylglutamate amidohydrolase